MAAIAERILEVVRYEPLDDDVLAQRLDVRSRQSINQTARRLAEAGETVRSTVHPQRQVRMTSERLIIRRSSVQARHAPPALDNLADGGPSS
jgi:ribose 1,5-bisphosphokinase PhnN